MSIIVNANSGSMEIAVTSAADPVPTTALAKIPQNYVALLPDEADSFTTADDDNAFLSSWILANRVPGNKWLTKAVVLRDGATLSIQASENHYCTPRTNQGPWTQVEIMLTSGGAYVTAGVIEKMSEDDDPVSYLPCKAVLDEIAAHGGPVGTMYY